MEGAVIAAVPDSNEAFEKGNRARLGLSGRYYNSGVLLIDCKAIRGCFTRSRMGLLITDIAAKINLVYPDQDLINLIYQGKIKTLNTVWNFSTSLKNDIYMIISWSEMQQVKIIHYLGDAKPWRSEYTRWFVFEYWAHLKKFLTANERRAYWKRKKLVREQFKRIPRKFRRLLVSRRQ